MLKLGLSLEGKIFITWYGWEITQTRLADLANEYSSLEEIDLLESYHDYFDGIRIKDHRHITDRDLILKYFFPGEEDTADAGEDRKIDLSKVNVIVRQIRRKKCDPGHVYLAGGEYGRGYGENKHFDMGFQPPLKPETITLVVDDLSDFGYNGFVLTQITLSGKKESYSETEAIPGNRLAAKVLED